MNSPQIPSYKAMHNRSSKQIISPRNGSQNRSQSKENNNFV